MDRLRACCNVLTVAAFLVALPPSASRAQTAESGFQSDQQLRDFLLKRRPPATTPAQAGNEAGTLDNLVVTAEIATPSVTNNQEAGVDEGGTIKAHGDTLLILRRGKLFSVSIVGGRMHAVSAIDCFPPGLDASNDWYDEMLVAKDYVVVIGYSYSRGGTLINRFRIDKAGRLSFEDAYQLGSSDYYSSRNYASRRIGRRLVLFSPIWLNGDDPLQAIPRLGRWSSAAKAAAYTPTASARQIFIPKRLRQDANAEVSVLHAVTSCDLTSKILSCRTIGMLGGWSRNFYVSPKAVYVWTQQDWVDTEKHASLPSFVYRLPLDGGMPTALGVRGGPVDQFGFREDRDGTLKVLVRSSSDGDLMWNPEFTDGSIALLTVPLSAFGQGEGEAPSTAYRRLPTPPDGSYRLHDRFVGRYVLYGFDRPWQDDRPRDGVVVAAPLAGGQPAWLNAPGGVDRIEAMGDDAVAIGANDDGLYFSAIQLMTDGHPWAGKPFELKGATQHGSRSHAFVFHPDNPSAHRVQPGVVAFPVNRDAAAEYSDLFDATASMLYLRRSGAHFSALGELPADEKRARDDGCTVSCVDWYGNARPVFIGRRMFALLGYELVEGRLDRGRVHEVGRLDFTPPRPAAQ